MDKKILKERQAKLLKTIKKGIAIIPSGSIKTRSNDTDFEFRQDNNFAYLTNFHEDNAVLIVLGNHPTYKTVLFVQPKNPEMELWTGVRWGVDKATTELAVDKVFSIEELNKELPELMVGHDAIFMDMYNRELVEKILPMSKSVGRKEKIGKIVPRSINDLNYVMGLQRLVKDDFEIEQMRKAVAITKRAYDAAFAFTAPGKNEHELYSLLDFMFKQNGGSGPAYGTIVAGGNNANTLHYVFNNQELKDGQLLLIDAGSEFNLYSSDITRTFPINGKFTPAQKEIYQLVLNVEKEIIKMIKPGVPKKNLQEKTSELLAQGLIDLGILKMDLNTAIKEKHINKYYPHGVGHWLGMDVHDPAPSYIAEEPIVLEAGMLLTVEPGLYLPENDQALPEKYRGIGIRIEDDILVTKSGHENLSIGIPKEIDEVEQACKKNYKDFI